MIGIGDYPAELVNERPLQDRTVAISTLLPFLIAVGLAFLLIGVNALTGPIDPALQDVGPIVGP